MKSPTSHILSSIRQALKNYRKSQWLGQHSLLASPYFLGTYLKSTAAPHTHIGRGEALQQLLYESAAENWPGVLPQSRQGLWNAVEDERRSIGNGGPCYLFLLLDIRYFRRYFPPHTPPSAVGAMYDFLNVSESSFFRHLNEAVEALAKNLLRLVQPSLRLERPVLSAPLIGREKLLSECVSALEQGKSVALSGSGGIGKSSLGTAVLEAWSENHAFWYTIRPGLNDHLASVLFSLGHFLHKNGRSNLWLHLISTNSEVESTEQSLGFLREDLSPSPGQRASFLLCFDEVDLLQTETLQPRHGVHKLVLELLEGLCLITPLLLIGQRALIDTDTHHALRPLTVDDVAMMIERAGQFSKTISAEKIQLATGGNPRLVELYLALLEDDDQDLPRSLKRAPAVKPLFNRLWKRLNTHEKEVLAGLSVYRSNVPPDVWSDHPGLKNLSRRQLIKSDAFNGIGLLPAFRQIVYDELIDEQRHIFHRKAADVRVKTAQYTSATYHLCQADDAETAIQLWFKVQDEEITQGNAGAAYAIFEEIQPQRLDESSSRQLRVLQNRLYLMFGELESVLEGMDSYSWHVDDELGATALEQWGEAHRLLGDLDAARSRFDESIIMLGRLTNQIVSLRVKRGHTWGLESNHSEAEREAVLAQIQVDTLRGEIENNRGQFRQSMVYLNHALKLARSLNDEPREARANYLISIALGNLGKITEANIHAKSAMDYYEKVGNRRQLEGLRAEMAGILLNVGRFSEVIEPATKALRFFEQINHSHWPGQISSNLAEAYFETGDLKNAEAFARRAISTENPPVQPYAYYTLAQVFQAKGNSEAANQAFQVGLQWAEQKNDAFIAAYLHRVFGSFLLSEGHFQQGRSELEKAWQQFSALGISHEEEKTRHLLAKSQQGPYS